MIPLKVGDKFTVTAIGDIKTVWSDDSGRLVLHPVTLNNDRGTKTIQVLDPLEYDDYMGTSCLDADELLGYITAKLDVEPIVVINKPFDDSSSLVDKIKLLEAAKSRVESHMAKCDSCREVIEYLIKLRNERTVGGRS